MLPRPAKSVQNGAGFSGKTGTNWACRKGRSGLSATERAVGKNARAALAKRKRNRAVYPEYQIMRGRESRWARAAPWREKGGSEREHGVERVNSIVKEGRFQGGKGGQATRASLEQVEGSMSGWVDTRALQDDLQSLGFTPSLAKPEIGKEVGRRRARSWEKRVKWVRVTRRGGREASVSSRGIGDDERQPVMARLAARWRRSNLVILVALRKGNHSGEA